MRGAASALDLSVPADEPMGIVAELTRVRAAAENGATRSDLLRDLAPLVSHRLSPSELRTQCDNAIGSLLASGQLSETRGRFRLTECGLEHVAAFLGKRKLPASWAGIRDARLVAAVLGLPAEPMVLKSLSRPEGLRAAILQRSYNLGGKRLMGVTRLRMALAVVALERAFGNKIKSGLDAGRGLSVKASRLLAGQLAQRPRDFGTDTRLVAALAAEAIGASQGDPNSLRQALLRRYFSERLGQAADGAAAARTAENDTKLQVEVPASLNDNPQKASPRPPAALRPDLDGFVSAVLVSADKVAEGWPGNRKALIAPVWRALSAAHPEWGLSEIEFKSMLAEAHRTGHIILGSADIKSKDTLKDVQDSAIAYKNTVWHFIRVEN